MTKVESYINYSKNILHNVRGYNLHNARRFYGDDYIDFYTVYINIMSDIEIYNMYGFAVLVNQWYEHPIADRLPDDYIVYELKDKDYMYITDIGNDPIDYITNLYKITNMQKQRFKITMKLDNSYINIFDKTFAVLQNEDKTRSTELEWQDATIVNLMEVLNGRK